VFESSSRCAQEDAHVAYVRSRWSSRDGVAERSEKRIRIAAIQEVLRVQANSAGALEGRTIYNRTCCRTIAVDTVSAGAERDTLANLIALLFRADSQAES